MTISLETDPFLFERLLYCPQLIQENIFSRLPWENTLAWSQVLRGYKHENAQIEQNTCALFPSGPPSCSQQQALRHIKAAVDSPNVWSVFTEQMGFEPGNRSRAEVIHLVKVLFRQAHLLGKEVPKSIAVPSRDIQSLNEHRRIAYGRSRLEILKEIVDPEGAVQLPNELEGGIQENPNSLVHIDPYVEWLLNWCKGNPTTLSNRTSLVCYLDCHFLTHDVCMIPNLSEFICNSSSIAEIHPDLCNLSSLRTLTLSRNRITQLPPNFGNLRFLQHFVISRNRLTTLPDSFGNLTALYSLSLYGNRLTDLPESLSQLSSLKYLDLSDNAITALPHNFCNLDGLEYLVITNTYIKELPTNFGNLTSLKKLNLMDNKLTTLPPTFGNLSLLCELYLQLNFITDLPDNFSKLISLKELNLSNNHLTAPRDYFQSLTFINSINLENAFL